MRIKAAHKQKQSTVLEIDTGNPKAQHFHIIPDGVLETRMEAWGLNEEEALDLLVAEANTEEELPDRFETKDLKAARSQVRSVAKGNDVTWGVSKSEVLAMAVMPPEIGRAIREHIREEISAAAPVSVGSAVESMADNVAKLQEVRQGYERRAEELLADEIVAASPGLKRAPRGKPEEPVGLTVKYV